ncbi:hypothetical protein C8J57DRAFT_153656 [Mycena rebaudengoi]|nr:hypothetical protein C8J57DRAFT_153656 [Mycena rebaudengoi]
MPTPPRPHGRNRRRPLAASERPFSARANTKDPNPPSTRANPVNCYSPWPRPRTYDSGVRSLSHFSHLTPTSPTHPIVFITIMQDDVQCGRYPGYSAMRQLAFDWMMANPPDLRYARRGRAVYDRRRQGRARRESSRTSPQRATMPLPSCAQPWPPTPTTPTLPFPPQTTKTHTSPTTARVAPPSSEPSVSRALLVITTAHLRDHRELR